MAIRKYHIGCTGWSLKEWVGDFFTDNAKPVDFLKQYASVFNSVEGNTSFYHIPKKETIKKWRSVTPDGFKFCFKFHKSITHTKRLNDVEEDVLNFLEAFDPITDRLGPFLIQLPPQFSSKEFSRLEHLVKILPAAFRYGVEVRHSDYFDHGQWERRLNRLLKSYNLDRIIFDTRKLHSLKVTKSSIVEAKKKKPKVPVRFTSTGTHPIVRFVGSNDPIANEPYLKEWAIILADWIREGKHPYIFTHSPDKISQPLIGRTFHRLLSNLIPMDPMPATPRQRQNDQLSLF